jgi:uncharacterized protein (DUF58 family)
MKPMALAEWPLESPGVAFGPDFQARLARLVGLRRLRNERREGPGRAGHLGAGQGFEGYRPYRPGENLRDVDWGLYARLDRPFVRLARREASERWALLLDASASMGLGRPGKLQLAAECAAGVVAIGLLSGAEVRVLVAAGDALEPRELAVRRTQDMPRLFDFLTRLQARGTQGLRQLLGEPARLRAVGRVLVIGDFFDVSPAELLGLAQRGRELAAAQILAPIELAPGAELAELEAVEWVDPESGARRVQRLDAAARRGYAEALQRRLELWRSACARHRVPLGTWSSATPFETLLNAWLAT